MNKYWWVVLVLKFWNLFLIRCLVRLFVFIVLKLWLVGVVFFVVIVIIFLDGRMSVSWLFVCKNNFLMIGFLDLLGMMYCLFVFRVILLLERWIFRFWGFVCGGVFCVIFRFVLMRIKSGEMCVMGDIWNFLIEGNCGLGWGCVSDDVVLWLFWYLWIWVIWNVGVFD